MKNDKDEKHLKLGKSVSFTVTLRGEDSDIFDEYFKNYILQSENIYVRPSALVRYMIIDYIKKHGNDCAIPSAESVRDYRNYRKKRKITNNE